MRGLPPRRALPPDRDAGRGNRWVVPDERGIGVQQVQGDPIRHESGHHPNRIQRKPVPRIEPPFEMPIALRATYATLSASSVTIPAGAAWSEEFTVTEAGGS